jgi:small subunit ribosomal protein S9
MEEKETTKVKKDTLYTGTGRRKRAVARVWLWHKDGEVTINGKPLKEVYPDELTWKDILLPFFSNATPVPKFTVSVKTQGGGKGAQKEAIKMGLARALEKFNLELRPAMKKRGLLRRDPREKERKKYYLRRARKRPQYSKR